MLELRLNKNNQIDVTYMSETSAELSECSQCYLPFIYIILQHLDAGYTHIHTNTRAHTHFLKFFITIYLISSSSKKLKGVEVDKMPFYVLIIY